MFFFFNFFYENIFNFVEFFFFECWEKKFEKFKGFKVGVVY